MLIHIRLEDELVEKLDEAAATDGRSRAGMLGIILAEYFGVKRLPRITNGKIDTKKAAGSLLAPTGAGIAQVVDEMVEKKVPEKCVRASDLCPHRREYQHCTLAICKATLTGATRSDAG